MAVIGSDRYDIEKLGNALKKVKDSLGGEFEFLITNDRITVRDPEMLFKEYRALLDSMQELYLKYKDKEKKELET